MTKENLTFGEILDLWQNHPDEKERIGPVEAALLAGRVLLVGGLTTALIGIDLLSGDEAVMSRDDRREGERILKNLVPPFGKVVEKMNNIKDSLDNPQNVGKKRPMKTVRQVMRSFHRGDHIAVERELYSHHAIYDGENGVIEYDDFVVRRATLEEFAKGAYIYKVEEQAAYEPEEIIERAVSRMGERDYDLLFNNCEHFATWCRCG